MLFVGRLSKSTRARDLEDIFEAYGHVTRCDIKYGAEMAYAFVDYEDRRDAEDALRYENGRDVCGSSIIVEWAKGNPRRSLVSSGQRAVYGYDECYKCHKVGHWARDCTDDRNYGYRRQRGGRSSGGGRSRSRSPRRRSRSPRRRRSSRSRSRGRRRRSKSRSRSRSTSRDNKRRRRTSRSRSRSRDQKSKSVSQSPGRQDSRSRSRSPDKNGDIRDDKKAMQVVDEID